MTSAPYTSSPFAPIFLLMLGVSLVISYGLVRRGRVAALIMLAIGGLIDVLLFGLFALAQGDPVQQAVVVGILLGIMFNTLAVLIALFFRRNATERQPTA